MPNLLIAGSPIDISFVMFCTNWYEIFILIDDNIVNGIKDGLYYISNYGRLYSRSSGKFLKSKIGNVGYPEYTLRHKNGKPLTVHIHRIIMKAFKKRGALTHFQILSEISKQDPHLKQKDLAKKLGITIQAVSENINIHDDGV